LADTVSSEVLCLVSGGLDSLLARELALRGGAHVRSVHFDTGFVHASRRASVERLAASVPSGDLRTLDVTGDFLREVVLRPKHGYGAGMNPCLDCRVFLLRRAWDVARESGISWLVTGEVLGQRAFDQSRRSLELTELEAGVSGRVLRPLSTALLSPGGASRPGLTDTPLRMHGRTRAAQLALARRLGIEDHPTPSGGCCRLADASFARRLRDLVEHRDVAGIGRPEIERLERGRHFRLAWNVKVVVARDEAESAWLVAHAGEDRVGRATDGRGSVALVEGRPDPEQLATVASLIARYAGARDGTPAEIELVRGPERTLLRARPATGPSLAQWRI